MTARELWADMKESVGAALDRVHPGVVIVAGLAAVVIAFGAFGLALLSDGSALDDLGLDSPPRRAAEGDPESGSGGTGVGVGGDSLSEGLTTHVAGGGGGSGDDAPSSGADGRSEDSADAAGAPSPGAAAGSPATAPPSTGPTSTSATVPGTTAPPTPTTTPGPPSTEPPPEPGLVGGLLDLLGLG